MQILWSLIRERAGEQVGADVYLGRPGSCCVTPAMGGSRIRTPAKDGAVHSEMGNAPEQG